LDLYNYQKTVSDAIALYKQSDDPNQRKVVEFTNKLIAENLSYARIWKYIYCLREIDKRLGGKSFVSVTKQDIENLISELNMSQYSEWTKHSYRVVIKRFWKWLSGDENYPSEVKWIKASCKQRNKIAIRPEDVLTADEVRAMVESCPTVRDKAMILTLFESGMRPSELLTMRIRNVRFEEQGAYLSATGKTGDKVVFVYLSAPLLSQWISQHPLNKDPDSFIWISLNPVNYLGIISPQRLGHIVKRAARKAGIQKRVWTYLLRHSAATDDAKQMSHAVLCAKFGWSAGSAMPGVYVHLGASDIRNAQLGKYGLVAPDAPKLEMQKCPRCIDYIPSQQAFIGFTYGCSLAYQANIHHSRAKRR
jgi:integrase